MMPGWAAEDDGSGMLIQLLLFFNANNFSQCLMLYYTGNTYYRNLSTGHTQWEKPQGGAANWANLAFGPSVNDGSMSARSYNTTQAPAAVVLFCCNEFLSQLHLPH